MQYLSALVKYILKFCIKLVKILFVNDTTIIPFFKVFFFVVPLSGCQGMIVYVHQWLNLDRKCNTPIKAYSYLSDVRRAVGRADASAQAYDDVISKEYALFKVEGYV